MATKNKMSYENGKVYKIIGTDPTDKCYVGSTTKQYLSQRLTKHKDGYKRWKEGKTDSCKLMSFELFEKYGTGNCKIILLENCKANSKDELRTREQHWIDNLECINKNNAIRTDEQKVQYKADYYAEKKEAILAINKKYRESHQAEILACKKKYAELNKEAIRARKQIMIHCDICDCAINKDKKARHEKTQKHIMNMEKL